MNKNSPINKILKTVDRSTLGVSKFFMMWSNAWGSWIRMAARISDGFSDRLEYNLFSNGDNNFAAIPFIIAPNV